jgi:hypothetical protein
LYSLCAGAAKNPSAPTPLPSGARGEEWADEAMCLLKRAVSKRYNNVEQIKKDKDLDSLRDRQDFKKLLAELETSQGKEKTPPK